MTKMVSMIIIDFVWSLLNGMFLHIHKDEIGLSVVIWFLFVSLATLILFKRKYDFIGALILMYGVGLIGFVIGYMCMLR